MQMICIKLNMLLNYEQDALQCAATHFCQSQVPQLGFCQSQSPLAAQNLQSAYSSSPLGCGSGLAWQLVLRQENGQLSHTQACQSHVPQLLSAVQSPLAAQNLQSAYPSEALLATCAGQSARFGVTSLGHPHCLVSGSNRSFPYFEHPGSCSGLQSAQSLTTPTQLETWHHLVHCPSIAHCPN